MAFCFVTVHANVPPVLLESLTVYKQTHQLGSVSQAVTTILETFFKLESLQLHAQLHAALGKTNLLQRLDRIENIILRLEAQRIALEGQGSFTPLNIKHGVVNAACESKTLVPVQAQQWCRRSLTAQLVEPSGDAQGSLLNKTASTEARSQVPLSNAHLYPFSAELASEDWTKGITTNRLVARLQTNPATLKKYLRDLKQKEWAVQRDPNGLGWTYDPLLERYYPVPMKVAAHASTGIMPTFEAERPAWLERQATQNGNCEPEPDAAPCKGHECKGGLTQSQLARLTAIPNNTLQRWKYLPDCAERIRCRTEGTYAYWYSEPNRRFYSL